MTTIIVVQKCGLLSNKLKYLYKIFSQIEICVCILYNNTNDIYGCKFKVDDVDCGLGLQNKISSYFQFF